MERGDKYTHIRPWLQIIFKQNYASYGYRRMKLVLVDEGINLSEKVIRHLMTEENLQVNNRRYQKWVTDTTEFTIQAGKIYLSPIIDCFDGKIVGWSIGGTS